MGIKIINAAGYEVELDACDLAADAEGRAIIAARKLRNETQRTLGLDGIKSKSQTRRHRMVRGSIGAQQRSSGTTVPIRQLTGSGPLGHKVRLKEIRQEK